MSESKVIEKINDILLKSGCITVNKNLARNIGLDAAILYSEICSKYKYFKQKEMLDEDGYFFNTVEDMSKDTFLSDYRQREAIKKLKELGLIYYKKRGIPARRYFKVNFDYDRIARLTENPISQDLKNRASNFEDILLKKLDSNNTNPNNPNIINTNIINGIFTKDKNTSDFNEYLEPINYYLKIYQEQMNRPHPILKKEKWREVISRMEDFSGGYCVDFLGDFYSLIDRYFITNFPNHPCDRNILHFTSDKIMLNRLYDEQRYE